MNQTRFLEEAAVKYMVDIGRNPLHFADELGMQPIRIRSIMSGYMQKSHNIMEAAKPQQKGANYVNRSSSTWKTKVVAGISMLAALGMGIPTIARMVNRPEHEVKTVVDLNQQKIQQMKENGKARRNEPIRYPLQDRKKVEGTQEHLWFTRILFAEAANQPIRAKEAVAQVVMNRVKSGRYPINIMGVILQSKQFSGYNSRLWRISEKPDELNTINKRAYLQCADVARRAIEGQLPNHVGVATLYHDKSISLPWTASKVKHIIDIGHFSFYQEIR
jgi:hypothetical protein